MSVAALDTNVFLAFSPRDKVAALQLTQRLADEGVTVKTMDAIPAKDLSSQMRATIAECDAFVVLATEASVPSATFAFEVGAARGLDKPVFVVAKDLAKSDLPSYLREFPIVPYASVEKLADQVYRNKRAPRSTPA
jgi:nucleoside 2-deoxyribosyltransferase